MRFKTEKSLCKCHLCTFTACGLMVYVLSVCTQTNYHNIYTVHMLGSYSSGQHILIFGIRSYLESQHMFTYIVSFYLRFFRILGCIECFLVFFVCFQTFLPSFICFSFPCTIQKITHNLTQSKNSQIPSNTRSVQFFFYTEYIL